MFNFLISGNDEAFQGDPWILDHDRVFEHTHDAVSAPYRELNLQQIEQLCRMPTLIGFERYVAKNARLAGIDRVRLRNNEVRIEYTFIPNLPGITPEQLESLVWDFDIGKLELNRTHWALKDVDLKAELVRAGIINEAQFAAIPAEFRDLFGTTRVEEAVQVQPKIFRIPDRPIEPDLVSVMVPFNGTFTPVFQAITEVGNEIGLRVLNANQVWEESEIIQDIFSLIYRSAVVICDFSNRNANVFYEAGIAHTLGKPVIPIVQRAEDIPFDLQQHRYIVYLNNDQGRRGLRDDLLPRLRSLVQRAAQ